MDAILRRLWWILFASAVVVALLGVGDVLSGVAFEPTGPAAISGLSLDELEAASPEAYRVIDVKTRTGGLDLVAIGFLLSAIAWFPYRRAERWSWFAMWTLPVWFTALAALPIVYGLAPGESVTGVMLSGPAMAVVAAVVLLVDGRRFRTAPVTA